MSVHAFKRVPPAPKPQFSFVAAVKKSRDLWWIDAPPLSRDPHTHDMREFAAMWSMEHGHRARVDLFADVSDYPPMEVGEHGFGYCATRRGYDLGDPIGIGYSRFAAIAALLDAEELRNA